MARTKKPGEKKTPPPAKTVEGREKQLINLAVDLAERQMRDGSATSQVITHFLKLGTSLAELERARLENENKLLEAKVDQIQSSKEMKRLYAEAIISMKAYQGIEEEEFDDEEIL